MITRDARVATMVDEVISMAPPPPALPQVEIAAQRNRRPLLVVILLAVCGVVAALLVTAPWSNGQKQPTVVAPAQGTTGSPTTTLPLLPVDEALQVPAERRWYVSDHHGLTPGWVIRDELESQDLLRPALARVYNDAGRPVGYYGNFSGFVDTDVAQAAGFDQLRYAIERSANGAPVPEAVKRMTVEEVNECMSAFVSGGGTTAERRSSTQSSLSPACEQLLRLQGWPVEDLP